MDPGNQRFVNEKLMSGYGSRWDPPHVTLDGQEFPLSTGDSLLIPGHSQYQCRVAFPCLSLKTQSVSVRGQYRCIKAGTEKLKNSFYLKAIRLLNSHH
ncbi:hypothetical protein J4Q44_G00358090 [Coregonus suidteri]|uniref:Uncharacterized protein n=1 Tax=Coregonus suidteri TaxID=861788 RepID=A0AAN8KKZ2_9TELE